MEASNKTINDAQALKQLKEADAQAKAHEIVLRAQASKKEKILQAQADRITFLTKSAARKELSFEQEMELCLDGVNAVLAGGTPQQVAADIDSRRQALIEAQA